MRILVTRPREDGTEIARLLLARGHQALLAPLLEPRFPEGPLLEAGAALEGVIAILATSANGIRALSRRTERRDLEIYAVGSRTEGEARRAGFASVRSADGDAIALAEATAQWAPPGSVLLHVCAEDAPAKLSEQLGNSGFVVRRCPLYRIEPAQALPSQARTALQEQSLDAVMLFSPRTAAIFVRLVEGLPTERLDALCISRATAASLAPLSFAQIRIAAQPNQHAMLALAP
jgi:uroporphyrinogen-III synthase